MKTSNKLLLGLMALIIILMISFLIFLRNSLENSSTSRTEKIEIYEGSSTNESVETDEDSN